MSELRKSIKNHKSALISIFALAAALMIFDVCLPPENQVSARVYIGFVREYQEYGRPLLDGKVACRFRPTCSDYSIQAVEKHGIAAGLYLTFKRLLSCTNDVPMRTVDQVPE